jgi:hypothetical protein
MRRAPPRKSTQTPLCAVCAHPRLDTINAELATDAITVTGAAARYSLDRSAVWRHRARHLPLALLAAEDARRVASATMILEEVETIRRFARSVMASTVRTDPNTALRAMDKQLAALALLAKVAGLMADVNVTVSLAKTPEWLTMRDRIVAAVAPWPDARRAVIEAVRHLELVAG